MDKVYEFFDYISQKFGESSETLIKEYAKSNIASDLAAIVVFIAAIILCVIVCKKAKRMVEDEDSSYIDDGIAAGISVGCFLVLAASFILLLFVVPDLISYIVSPTGTVLREVLSKF